MVRTRMEFATRRSHILRAVAAVAIAVSLAACAQTPKPEDSFGISGKGGPATPGSSRDFAVNVGDIVYFTTDSTDLSPEAQQTLANQARWLQKYAQYTITIEGHADERGTREYNIALGQKRADAVKNMMLLYGAQEIQIETVSFGKEKPRREGHDEPSWAENRRVDIVHSGE